MILAFKDFPFLLIKSTIIFLLIFSGACSFNKNKSEIKVFQASGENHILPQPVGYVSDFEGIFTQSEIKELNAIISRHQLATDNQIAIVTLNSIEPYNDISEFTMDLANYWEIGRKDHKKGVIIAFSTKLKKVRIQNGIGIENRLTDDEALEIIDNVIIPDFKSKNFYEGVKKGLVEVIHNLEQIEEQ